MTSITKILIVQSETRKDANYLTLTQRSLKEKAIPFLNSQMVFSKQFYEYKFIDMKEYTYRNRHPAVGKLFLFRELLEYEHGEYDILIFLDSDAWINNAHYLMQLMTHLMLHPEKHGCFSRDPCRIENTFVNSGSFILKMNDYNRRMMHSVFIHFYEEGAKKHHTDWPYDQVYLSNYIFEHKEDYFVFHREMINTPFWKVLRHNWWKDNRLYIDLYNILENSFDYGQRKEAELVLEDQLDDTEFPNTYDTPNIYKCM